MWVGNNIILKKKSQTLLPHRDGKLQYMDQYLWELHKILRRCCFKGVWKAKSKHTETYEASFNSTLTHSPTPSHPILPLSPVSPVWHSSVAFRREACSWLLPGREEKWGERTMFWFLEACQGDWSLVSVSLIWALMKLAAFDCPGPLKTRASGTACSGAGGPAVPEIENECGLEWLENWAQLMATSLRGMEKSRPCIWILALPKAAQETDFVSPDSEH